MNKLILVIFLSICSFGVWADIQVQVNPAQVNLGENFTLTLIQTNAQNGGVPDLSALRQDFSILGTERNISYTVINGSAQTSSQWSILLSPLKTGILTIPAIKLGQEQSNPVTINVGGTFKSQDVQNTSSQQQDLMLTGEVSHKKPYLNQQVIYTVKLYNSKRLLDADYQGPQVDNALLIPLGDTNRSSVVQNNINYVVEEQRYAIFPQKSGTMSIKSPTFNALVYDIDSQRVHLQDKTINLNVQPIPKEYRGKIWLPAKHVELTEQYDNANQALIQGGTLTRTVVFRGVAIPAQLLPKLEFAETDAFNVYPEKGTERNQVSNGELVGSTEFKVTYLFNKSGKVTIPELKLHWFNTQTGKDEVAVLPAKSFDITASSTTPVASVTQIDTVKQTPSEPIKNTNWAWIIAAMFACAWIITLGLWFWQKQPRNTNKKRYKNALNELNKACTQRQPKQARDALLHWASLHWPDAPVLNLNDVIHLVKDAHLKKQIQILSEVLYKSEAQPLWRGDELLRAVHATKKEQIKKKNKSNALPPSNPL